MSLRIYNSLSKQKEVFVSLVPGEVKMYVCGPTVYNLLHVGNFRGPIFFNLVRNWLELQGYQVTFAYNYTDVDDRIIDKSLKEGIPSEQISERYIAEFKTDFAALGLRPHDHNPKVTDTMLQIIDMVSELVKCERAYVTKDGEVLYSVRQFEGYGKLSHKNIDDLIAGSRVEVDAKKRDPLDFALWKPAKPGEPKWSSPWGDGRPGWHIECSAMIRHLLGASIDIHGGGSDLIFPHHENEIAQSEGATGKPFVKYWMHNNMLTFGDRKMSKSLGNIITAREFVQKYDAEILKYMMLSVHYRSLSDFSEQAVGFAVSGLARIYSALSLAEKIIAASAEVTPGVVPSKFLQVLSGADQAVSEALNDDFNTPEMFASLFVVVRTYNGTVKLGQKITPEHLATAQAFRNWFLEKGHLMSLFNQSAADYLVQLDDMLLESKGLERQKIDQLVEARAAARTAKDFSRSDEVRNELTQLGINVQDTPQGSYWEVAK
jgi:cysteinyl-tRNA synthetase